MRTSRHIATLAALVVACGGQASDPVGHDVAERSDDLQVGVERVIPLRIISIRGPTEFVPATGGAAGGTTVPANPFTNAEIREKTARLLTRTNAIWRPTGIQFTARDVRQVQDANFASIPISAATVAPWNAGLKARIESILGVTVWPVGSPPPVPINTTEYTWLHEAVLEFGERDAYYLMFGRSTTQGFGNQVWRSIHLADGPGSRGFGDNVHLAHELGHAFGLPHTFLAPGATHTDPRTNATATRTDFWDLYYCPGTSASSPNQYFASWADSVWPGTCADSARLPVGASCAPTTSGPSKGQVTCTLPGASGSGYSETGTHLVAPVANVAGFTGDQAGTTVYGSNTMSYDQTTSYHSFSPSQVRMIRENIRHDRRSPTPFWASTPNPPYIGKPRLGTVSSRAPLAKIDFNGGGLRDLAVWTARPTDAFGNTAAFEILLAPSFSGAPTVRYFGNLDDIPALADYDGHGRTDIAVYRPGESGTGASTDGSIWYWCPSAGAWPPPNCSTSGFQSAGYGVREDIPLPGLKLTASGAAHLAVYRPSNGTFYWIPAAGGVQQSRQVAVAGARSVPLVGLFDSDDLIDFATYDLVSARFDLVLSTENWSTATKRIQVFPSSLQMSFTGAATTAQRTGGIPVSGVDRFLSPGVSRSLFAVFDPNAGQWFTSDPLPPVASPYIVSPTVHWSAGSYGVPLGAVANGTSPEALLSVRWGTTPIFYWGSGASPNPNATPFMGDGTFALVPDLTNDGIEDVLMHDPETSTVHIVRSNSTFTDTLPVSLGGPFSELL